MKFSFIMCDPVPELGELAARMRRLAELGYQGVELVATHPLGYVVDELAAVAEQTRLPVVSLLSGWSYSNEGLCLSSPDEGVRDRAVTRLIEYVELAQRLGALVVVGLMQGFRSDEPDTTVANVRITEALSRVARTAESRRVPLIIEPVNHLQVSSIALGHPPPV